LLFVPDRRADGIGQGIGFSFNDCSAHLLSEDHVERLG
jgi:hypothetical protein